MSLIANCNRDPKKRPKPYRPEDFLAPEEDDRTGQEPDWRAQYEAMKKYFQGK